MLGNFRMGLVSQRFGACANGGNCEVCSVMPGLPCERRGPGDRPLRECEGAQARSLLVRQQSMAGKTFCQKVGKKPPIRKSFLVCCEGDKVDCQTVPGCRRRVGPARAGP